MSSQSVPATSTSNEVADTTAKAIEALVLKDSEQGYAGQHDDEQDENEEEEDDRAAIDLDGEEDNKTANTATPAAASAKKKKKKGKGKAKALDKLKNALGAGSSSKEASISEENDVQSSVSTRKTQQEPLSDELYERILQQARANISPEQAAKLDKRSVMEMIEAYNLREVASGKASGIGVEGKNKKDMADFKFWSTQPVPKLGSLSSITPDGPIEKDKPTEEVRQEAYPLPKDFEWCTMDLTDPVQLKEVYQLLTENYVEDSDATFRFDYSAAFIRWALMPPGFIKEWHVGVRVSASKRLVAFISGIPMELRVRKVTKKCSEINYLCVHKKLRSKRLAPVLIKEVTRRCNLLGVFQAVYTVGQYLPTPVSACQYYHRSLNTKKLVETGFSGVPRSSTLARLIVKNRVPDTTSIPGLREIEQSDAKEVGDLLRAYLARFDLAPVMSDEEIQHNFYSGKGKGAPDPLTGWREGQITWTYVVEDPETHRITDFFSFYTLPSTALRVTPQQTINAAYLFYVATTACPNCNALLPAASKQGTSSVTSWDKESSEDRKKLKDRLILLINDSLILANKMKFDVFNALTLQDNNLFLTDTKFGQGDGFLHYYLYNYQTRPIAGGTVDPALAATGVRQQSRAQSASGFDPSKGSGIGLVML